MKNIYQDHLTKALKINNESERLTYLTSILRSLLQLAVITSFEITRDLAPSDEIDLIELTTRFRKPADGLPLQILDNLTPILRSYTDNRFLYGWFETNRFIDEPLSKQLINWVAFRNRRPGHGVLDTSVISVWSAKTLKIIRDCLNVFSMIIPIAGEDGSLKLQKECKRPAVPSVKII